MRAAKVVSVFMLALFLLGVPFAYAQEDEEDDILTFLNNENMTFDDLQNCMMRDYSKNGSNY